LPPNMTLGDGVFHGNTLNTYGEGVELALNMTWTRIAIALGRAKAVLGSRFSVLRFSGSHPAPARRARQRCRKYAMPLRW
jgi:hypothetical protein